MSACAYAHFIFGFDGLEAVCGSRRLKGLAEIMHASKEPLKQSLVLSVHQVRWLHEQLESKSVNPVVRGLIAYVIIALYGRCRHSDLQFVEEVILDSDSTGGFVEITTRVHKT